MSETRIFNPRLIAGIAVAGIAAFAAFVLLLAYGGSLGSGSDGGAHPRSNSAVGFSGLVRLLDGRGETSFVRRAWELETDDLVVVALEERSDPRGLRQLLNNRSGRATLIILPKWMTVRDPARGGWVRRVGMLPPQAFPPGPLNVRVGRSRGGGSAEPHQFLTDISPPLPQTVQTISGKGLEPLLTTPDGDILLGRLGDTTHYVVAEPDLLNNHGIADRQRALAAVRLLEQLNSTEGAPVHFLVSLDGLASGASEDRSLLRLALEPPFLAMTLALLVAAFLGGYHGLNRFGPARREERAIAFGKAALVENSAGLIRQARREARLGEAYADVVRQEAARITAAPRGLAGPALDDYLDRFSAPGAPTFSQLAERLRSAGRRDALMSAARALAIWKEEIIR
jgi:hypothetical protein